MAQSAFNYKAVDRSGKSVEDRIDAEDRDTAISRLQTRGLIVLDIRPLLHGADKQGEAGAGRAKARLDDLVAVSRELSIMCRSGISVTEALGSIAENLREGGVRNAIADVQTRVLHGNSLSNALSQHPNVFPDLYIDMVRTAEEGGGLDMALARAADHMERALEMRRKIVAALIYPALLCGISVLTVTLMIVFILPRFMKLFDRMQIEIPMATQILMGTSRLLTTYWYMVPILIVGGIVLGRVLRKRPGYRQTMARIQIKIPILGDLIRKIAVSRSMSALATLLASSVPLLTALRTAAAGAQNPIIGDSLLQVRDQVEHGSTLAQAIGDTGEFPPLIRQMVSAGERTGQLPEILGRTVEFYESEVDAKIKGLTSIIEPLMIVVLGLVIGFIAVAIISPIYSLVGGVK